MKKKVIALVLVCVLVFGIAVGGTLAWLVTKTDSVVNTFTAGDVSITLVETGADQNAKTYKMVPGTPLVKDPTVTVKAVSEACYLFVKVEETANVDTFLTYAIADGWTPLADVDDVYYREVADTDADQSFNVIADNKVTVNSNVTKAQLNELASSTYPKITVTAYAVQKDNIGSVAAAWAEAENLG